MIKVLLCGNPNVGKTTVYNRLTRSSAPVGNWHGVTVEAREKRVGGDKELKLCDLPGAYSLTARSKEEEVTRDEVLASDGVILYVANVNDLRRDLYMLAQIMESRKKVVLLVNMMDEARGKVDLALLSKRLGIPVIGTSIREKSPLSAVSEAIRKAKPSSVPYALDSSVTAIAETLEASKTRPYLTPEFTALKIMEGDAEITKAACRKRGFEKSERFFTGACRDCNMSGECELRDYPALLRYGFIDKALDGVISDKKSSKALEKLDKIVLGRFAFPIFLLVMAFVFVITYELGKPLSELLTGAMSNIAVPQFASCPEWLIRFINEGVLCGITATLAFLPQVVILFLLTAILQDSGYMSRAAYVTDGFFSKFGLGGRAAFSFVLGLGCSATAVLSTRGMANKTARARTAATVPLPPCSARLAVFVAIASYFELGGIVVAAMYVIGIAAALVILKVMRVFGKKSTDDELLMEMPPYRLPSAKRILRGALNDVVSFVVRVGTVVAGVNAIVWLLCNFSLPGGFSGDGKSIMEMAAGTLAPIFSPLGFGNHKAVTALISGMAAKETVISTLASLGGIGSAIESKQAAVSYMIFICLYMPCIATTAAVWKEAGFKYAAASVISSLIAAYFVSLLYYQTAIGENIIAVATLWTCLAVFAAALVITGRVASAGKRKEKISRKHGKKIRT